MGATVDQVLTEPTPGLQWTDDGGPGVARIVGNRLVIRQNFAGHQKIVKLLNDLFEPEKDSTKPDANTSRQ